MKTYNDLVDKCKEILDRGWTQEVVCKCMDKNPVWAPDSIMNAIDDTQKRAVSKKLTTRLK
ncbi:hypothetical protein H9I32_14450 [Bacillus sp. Xin]|uniref:hypothetical protein n=1 Tax=unclassified Bacillus (in: firmicutes) TaxID=185979 RepID=UPI001573C193|nr:MULTISPECIES: hypothetical protein [unclassified Bacillus (in: firmicutes)]MBC6973515.1 hypothetical protein [Bacillus sp. Xin]NSW39334.1 hypothetical protein [Bacillus sp. Xin1]